MNLKAKYYIDKLKLIEHPEGGYFREFYRSEELVDGKRLHNRFDGRRCFSTAIYYLLESKHISLFHKLKSDEIWHHIDGGSVRIILLDQAGKLSEIVVGKNTDNGEVLHAVVRNGCWFAAEVADGSSFVLVTCTVAPGFEFDDFTLADRNELLQKYPEHKNSIIRYTKA